MIIKVENNINRFIDKCLKYHINLIHVDYFKNYLLVEIDEKDYKDIKRINYFSKIKIIKYKGKKGFLYLLKNIYYDLFMIILFVCLIFFYSNVIIRIDINHENKKLKERIKNTLKEYNIDIFTLKKDNQELTKISDDILLNNRDIIDFISINREGMRYIVNIEERILVDESKNEKNCHVIASKDGVITSIKVNKGNRNVELQELVHKGDILISGDIIFNEEIKQQVCASGEIMANTWYKVKVTYPFQYNQKIYTGKSRIQFYYNGNKLYKDSYQLYDEIILFKTSNFKIVKEKEYYNKMEKLSYQEAKNNALKEVNNQLIVNNNIEEDKIIKKVLKEYKNNSTIELEIFVEAEESIGSILEYESGENFDTE